MPQCTVACKIENGLTLRRFKMVDFDEPVLGGGTKTTKRAEQVGEYVVINGPRRLSTGGGDPIALANSGYALTYGVDEAFMTDWMAANKDHPAVVNGLIKVHAKAPEVKAMARDFESQPSGLEPLDQAGDKRVPKNKGQRVEKFDGKAAA